MNLNKSIHLNNVEPMEEDTQELLRPKYMYCKKPVILHIVIMYLNHQRKIADILHHLQNDSKCCCSLIICTKIYECIS